MGGCVKLSSDRKLRLRLVLKWKTQLEVATCFSGCDIKLNRGSLHEGFKVATKCKLKNQREVATNHSGRDLKKC